MSEIAFNNIAKCSYTKRFDFVLLSARRI